MEKLFILKKYRSTKEKILKGNIKQNKQKLSKSIDDLEYVKKECLEKEIKIKEINSDIKKLEENNTKLKSNINKIYAQINVINSKMGNKKMINKNTVLITDVNADLNNLDEDTDENKNKAE